MMDSHEDLYTKPEESPLHSHSIALLMLCLQTSVAKARLMRHNLEVYVSWIAPCKLLYGPYAYHTATRKLMITGGNRQLDTVARRSANVYKGDTFRTRLLTRH